MDNNEFESEVTEIGEETTSETENEFTEVGEETTSEAESGGAVSCLTFYDEYGNTVTLEIANNSEQQEAVLLAMSEQNAKLEEICQYSAFTFAILLAFVLYRILSGALSSMFGGG